MKKLPPLQKIYEAYSALADERFDLTPECLLVRSSDGSKEYTVTWEDGVYRSNDNATYWQGYAGYPVIVALLLQGELPYDSDVASWFSGIPWKQLNDTHKRDYDAALQEAFALKNLDKGQILRVQQLATEDHEALAALPIEVGRLSVPVNKLD